MVAKHLSVLLNELLVGQVIHAEGFQLTLLVDYYVTVLPYDWGELRVLSQDALREATLRRSPVLQLISAPLDQIARHIFSQVFDVEQVILRFSVVRISGVPR
jgi:hypothetical protein